MTDSELISCITDDDDDDDDKSGKECILEHKVSTIIFFLL